MEEPTKISKISKLEVSKIPKLQLTKAKEIQQKKRRSGKVGKIQENRSGNGNIEKKSWVCDARKNIDLEIKQFLKKIRERTLG